MTDTQSVEKIEASLLEIELSLENAIKSLEKRLKKYVQIAPGQLLDYETCLIWLEHRDKITLSLKEVIQLVLGRKLTLSKNYDWAIRGFYRGRKRGNKPNPIDINPIDIIEDLYQLVPRIPEHIQKAYRKITGKSLSYDDFSPIYGFFKRWSKPDLWTLDEAICLINDMSPNKGKREKYDFKNFYEDMLSRTTGEFEPKKYNLTRQYVEKSVNAGKLRLFSRAPVLMDSEVDPLEFMEWAETKGIVPHPLLVKLVQENKEATRDVPPALENHADDDDKILKRPSQRHKERCCALAAYFWDIEPELSVAAMARKEELKTHGCENGAYEQRTIEDWIRHLRPARKSNAA